MNTKTYKIIYKKLYLYIITHLINWEVTIMDYEYLILANCDEDNTADECANCPYKGESCNSQCMEVTKIYNPYIQSLIGG